MLRHPTAVLLLAVIAIGCIDRIAFGQEPRFGEHESYFPPSDSKGGWRRAAQSPDALAIVGIDDKKLGEAFEICQQSTKNGGLLVVRRGWLVYERYFGLGHREATCNLASCGKSVSSIAVGMLVAERPDLFPEGLDQKVFTPQLMPPEAFPLSDERKAKIKLGQLLAMSAGIRGNNPSYVRGEKATLDPPGPDGATALVDAVALGSEDRGTASQLTSARTLWCEPGEGYSYATSSIHLASVMLRHVSGEELETYVDSHLARPLSWERWGYGYKQSKQVTHTPGGGGIVLRPSDMLRFGYMLLRGGRWGERQVVPAEYVRLCGQSSPYNKHFPYSLQFNVNTNGEAPNLPRDAFWKSGSGGHVLYVVPSLDLVVWKLGGRDAQYSPADTGLATHPEAAAHAQVREGWKETIDAEAALRKTLETVVASIEPQAKANEKIVDWKLTRLDEVGGHKTTIMGAPKVIEMPHGKAVAFDGVGDGLFVDHNPLAGLERFTAEVVFRPDASGPMAQRFLHFQEDGSENRLLFETRLTTDNRWFLDSFIKSGDGNYTQFAEKLLHPIGPWYHAAVVVDGATMRHYVNGEEELSTAIKFTPQKAGRSSVGVRINKASWYKGAVQQIRITPRVLSPSEFLKP